MFTVNFIYSEKATKFCEISNVDLSYVVKSTVEFSQNFVAFSEYMNLKKKQSKFSFSQICQSHDFFYYIYLLFIYIFLQFLHCAPGSQAFLYSLPQEERSRFHSLNFKFMREANMAWNFLVRLLNSKTSVVKYQYWVYKIR